MAQSVLPLGPEEKIEAIIDTRDYETSRYLVMVTKNGQAKKTQFKGVRLAESDIGGHQARR